MNLNTLLDFIEQRGLSVVEYYHDENERITLVVEILFVAPWGVHYTIGDGPYTMEDAKLWVEELREQLLRFNPLED